MNNQSIDYILTVQVSPDKILRHSQVRVLTKISDGFEQLVCVQLEPNGQCFGRDFDLVCGRYLIEHFADFYQLLGMFIELFTDLFGFVDITIQRIVFELFDEAQSRLAPV